MQTISESFLQPVYLCALVRVSFPLCLEVVMRGCSSSVSRTTVRDCVKALEAAYAVYPSSPEHGVAFQANALCLREV